MHCRSANVFVLVTALAACVPALAQTPAYNLKSATAEEIRAWDISVGPAGKELPSGRGTAKEGEKLFALRCAKCHGPNGEKVLPMEGSLVGDKGKLTPLPLKTIGNWWPYATTLWDYIRRAMPQYEEGSLSPNEAYALSAFLLYKNDIIKEDDIIDRETLPKVQMPNRNGFVPARWEDLRRFRCPVGTCP